MSQQGQYGPPPGYQQQPQGPPPQGPPPGWVPPPQGQPQYQQGPPPGYPPQYQPPQYQQGPPPGYPTQGPPQGYGRPQAQRGVGPPQRESDRQAVTIPGMPRAARPQGVRDEVRDKYRNADRTCGPQDVGKYPAVCTFSSLTKNEDGTNGLLVEPGRPEPLAQKILSLLDESELRRRLGESALATVRSRFSVDQMAGAYARLYESLIGD